MIIKFSHDELTDLARGTLLARGFSPADAARFTARIVCNHKTKPATVTLILEECAACRSDIPVATGIDHEGNDVVIVFSDGRTQSCELRTENRAPRLAPPNPQ